MDFGKILLFTKIELLHYSLHGHELEIVTKLRYLGVIIQFTTHIHRKRMMSRQLLSMIKRALHYQFYIACLQHSWSLLSRVCISRHLQLKQQERSLRHRAIPLSRSTIYSWYQRKGVEAAQCKLGFFSAAQKKERLVVEFFDAYAC